MARLMSRISALCLVPLPLTLAACATGAEDYPSLAIRDVERVSGTGIPAPAPAVPQVPPLSANVQARIGQLVRQAGDAHAVFESRLGPASRAVSSARGAAAASESWISAQVALSELESARSGVMVAVAELDALYAQERLERSEIVSPDALALSEARGKVEAWMEKEDREITRLLSQLGG